MWAAEGPLEREKEREVGRSPSNLLHQKTIILLKKSKEGGQWLYMRYCGNQVLILYVILILNMENREDVE